MQWFIVKKNPVEPVRSRYYSDILSWTLSAKKPSMSRFTPENITLNPKIPPVFDLLF